MKSETATLQKIKVKVPSRYNVIFMNDNITPMIFVSEVLETFFNYDKISADVKMMEIHTNGSAIIGTYSYSEAETRKTLTDNCSKRYNYPLKVKIEESK